ncbi:MAG: ABC transporter permease [Pontiellaceae bacterium]|jgi:putative ABC transport system permease protein|nr:ABC transporter permease [Pontiellaceae bacterium]
MLTTLKSFLAQSGQTVIIALRALRRNKLRSGLTSLGIIIGVASVVTIVAVGNGAEARITGEISSLGQNMLWVWGRGRTFGRASSGLSGAGVITSADAEAIAREISSVVALSPGVDKSVQAIANGRNWATEVSGASEAYLSIRNMKLTAGSMFTARDVRASAKVAVIGSKPAHELFGPLNPIGQTVRVGHIPFIIIGLLEAKGASMVEQNPDDIIIIPYTTAMKRITGQKYLDYMTMQISSAGQVDNARKQIKSLLRQRHRLSAEWEDDFEMQNLEEITDKVGSITTIFTLLLGAIAGLSLLVGGIGIMNIMLVSVTERTREIGIRVAVGAQPASIKLQFLIEAVILSLLGGLIGVLLGVGISELMRFIVDFKAIVSINSIFIAFGVSVMIGVFFGYYPARKAAALNPIDALRYE